MRLAPFGAAGISRVNGFEVHNVNSTKPVLTNPSTPSTRAANAGGSPRLNAATARFHTDRIRIHSRSDPSCAPQTAVTR